MHRPLLVLFSLLLFTAACGERDDAASPLAATEGSTDCSEPIPAPPDIEYVEGPDPERGCATPNPTRSTDVLCFYGDEATGRCCGDVAWNLICRCGRWVCPAGTLLGSACTSHCEDDFSRPDAGQ